MQFNEKQLHIIKALAQVQIDKGIQRLYLIPRESSKINDEIKELREIYKIAEEEILKEINRRKHDNSCNNN